MITKRFIVVLVLCALPEVAFVAWASFAHPSMTETQLFLTYWPGYAVALVPLIILLLIIRQRER